MSTRLERIALDTGEGSIVYYRTDHVLDRQVVFLMHGLSANHSTWLAAIDALYYEGYAVIAPDIRGHGESDKSTIRERYSMDVLADDVAAILENEQIESAIFIGYSFGGSITIAYAVDHPDAIDGLMLISANHVTPLLYRWFGFTSYLLSGVAGVLGYLLLPFGPRRFLPYDPRSVAGYWKSVWLGLHTMPLSVNLWLVSTGLSMDMRSTIAAITAPVLIVRANADPFFSAKEAQVMANKLENANVVTLQSGHFIATEEAEVSIELIKGFLTTLT